MPETTPRTARPRGRLLPTAALIALLGAAAACGSSASVDAISRTAAVPPAAPAGAAGAPGAPAARTLTAAQLRAAAVTGADLGAGYTVTLITPDVTGNGEAAFGGRERADIAACQPVLDAVGPSNTSARPLAETDLSVADSADPDGGLFAGLLAYDPATAAQIQSGLQDVLSSCTSFTSVDQRGARAQHAMAPAAAPALAGGEPATGFTLTNRSAGTSFTQRATLVRAGSVLAVFSTVGAPGGKAPEPSVKVIEAQVEKLELAQSTG